MSTLIAFPILSFIIIFQSAVVSRMPLLHGTSDLIMLTITAWALQDQVKTAWQWSIIGGLFLGFISALPISITVFTYLLITAFALVLRRRVWQIPILAMFVVTAVGTLLSHIVSGVFVSISGASIPILDTLNLITLPSLILNLIIAVPIYALLRDLAEWLHPKELEL
ncbi:MAG: hypothetical protein PVG14_01210 [Anaerolineales bacterium]|jgi:hypothetical protein